MKSQSTQNDFTWVGKTALAASLALICGVTLSFSNPSVTEVSVADSPSLGMVLSAETSPKRPRRTKNVARQSLDDITLENTRNTLRDGPSSGVYAKRENFNHTVEKSRPYLTSSQTEMLVALVARESSFYDTAVSIAGAAGRYQMMPDYAQGLGLKVFIDDNYRRAMNLNREYIATKKRAQELLEGSEERARLERIASEIREQRNDFRGRYANELRRRRDEYLRRGDFSGLVEFDQRFSGELASQVFIPEFAMMGRKYNWNILTMASVHISGKGTVDDYLNRTNNSANNPGRKYNPNGIPAIDGVAEYAFGMRRIQQIIHHGGFRAWEEYSRTQRRVSESRHLHTNNRNRIRRPRPTDVTESYVDDFGNRREKLRNGSVVIYFGGSRITNDYVYGRSF
ncbi:MAG: transglycosylase SLT domain-containing protein [Candidatus Woesearchaeota archaeon]